MLYAFASLFSSLSEGWNALAGQNHSGWVAVLLLEEVTVSFSSFVLICRAYNLKLRNSAESSQVFDWLVSWTIFAQSYGIVGPNVEVWNLHQSSQANCWALVVRELEEGAVEWASVRTKQNTVGNSTHCELTNTEVKLTAMLGNVWPSASCILGWTEGVSTLNVGVVGAAQISGTAPKFWHNGSNCVKNCAGSLTGSDLRANFEASNQVVNSLVEAFRKLASLNALVESSLIWVGGSPLCKSFVPSLVSSQAALCNLASVSQSFFVDWE